MSRLRLALAAALLASGAGIAMLMLANAARPSAAPTVVLATLVGWSFGLSGLVAWQLRPANRIGPAMVATSALWTVAGLYWSEDPVVFSIGHAFESFYLAGIVYVLLAFPTGRLGTPLARSVAVAAFVVAGPAEIAFLLLGGHAHAGSCAGCPPFAFQLVAAGDVALGLQRVQHAVGLALAVAAVAVLVGRWRAASAPLRFSIAPVLWTGVAALPVLALWIADEALGGPIAPVADLALDVMLVAIPVSFLAGVARTRLARSAVAGLMIELAAAVEPGTLQVALGRALHDPSLAVAYWLPDRDRFVDVHGRTIALPGDGSGRAVTMIERDGRRIAALVHDPALADDEYLVRSTCAAAALALENERLQADLRTQLVEVQASRARIVQATEEERRRIERDLHDGTQQRLVSVAMTLGLADAKVAGDASAARALIAEARDALSAALTELRELSQGIHPAVLTERGLAPALDDLVLRMRVPVALDVALEERLPPPVETTAYYVVSESLTNVAKYARATSARVRIARVNGDAVLEIADDGAGGADPSRGSGLRGLRDRVEALGGRFALASPAGQGTIVRAEIPCA